MTNPRIFHYCGSKGGKHAQIIREKAPSAYKKFYDPFVGSCASIFTLQPNVASISDLDGTLIHTLNTIKKRPNDLCNYLLILQQEFEKTNDKKEWFVENRRILNTLLESTSLEHAARHVVYQTANISGFVQFVKGRYNGSFYPRAKKYTMKKQSRNCISIYKM